MPTMRRDAETMNMDTVFEAREGGSGQRCEFLICGRWKETYRAGTTPRAREKSRQRWRRTTSSDARKKWRVWTSGDVSRSGQVLGEGAESAAMGGRENGGWATRIFTVHPFSSFPFSRCLRLHIPRPRVHLSGLSSTSKFTPSFHTCLSHTHQATVLLSSTV